MVTMLRLLNLTALRAAASVDSAWKMAVPCAAASAQDRSSKPLWKAFLVGLPVLPKLASTAVGGESAQESVLPYLWALCLTISFLKTPQRDDC